MLAVLRDYAGKMPAVHYGQKIYQLRRIGRQH